MFSKMWQKKELEGQQPEKVPAEGERNTAKPKVVRHFSQRRPVADAVAVKTARLAHDVLAGVRLLTL